MHTIEIITIVPKVFMESVDNLELATAVCMMVSPEVSVDCHLLMEMMMEMVLKAFTESVDGLKRRGVGGCAVAPEESVDVH